MRDTSRFAQAVEITTATYDQVAGDYARLHEEMRPHWAERLEEFVDLLGEEVDRHPIPNGGVPEGDVTLAEFLQFLPVLDAGCGPGRDARALAAHDLPVLGIDLSDCRVGQSIMLCWTCATWNCRMTAAGESGARLHCCTSLTT
jgi:2-polyprenyl-3-methyl-5-hydroxy-6-metoxy-1,4-benzoquinol methylase